MTELKTEKLLELESKLGYEFQNKQTLETALTHRSFLNEARLAGQSHNERLEFLGDAVLELVITEHLFLMYPDRPEGDLTSFRAAVVRTESLAETANSLGLGEYVFMSRGEEATGGRTRPYILANTVEALIGAIYLDGGYTAAQKFIADKLIPKLPEIISKRLDIDPKSKLQEMAQEMFKFTPTYEVVSEVGPDHDRTFSVKVIISGKEYGVGSGKSKQEAEQNAAKAGLLKISPQG